MHKSHDEKQYILIQADTFSNLFLLLPVFKLLHLDITVAVLHCTAMCGIDMAFGWANCLHCD